jgi:hypothetical protein
LFRQCLHFNAIDKLLEEVKGMDCGKNHCGTDGEKNQTNHQFQSLRMKKKRFNQPH